jgi:hypothetical protein
MAHRTRRRARGSCGVALAFVGIFCRAAEAALPQGHLQVEAEPGVELVLDGDARATAEAPHGAIFRELSPGPHHLALSRLGYLEQQAVVLVSEGEVTRHAARPWQPIPLPTTGRDTGRDEGTGALVIDTLPAAATIDARSLGWTKLPKGSSPLVARELPAGMHRLLFCNDVKCIEHRAEIRRGAVLGLLVDFEPGLVIDRSDALRAARGSLDARCKKERSAEACGRACALRLEHGLELAGPACARLGAASRTSSSKRSAEPDRARPAHAQTP